MIKFASGVFAGVFLGACAFEIIKKVRPDIAFLLQHSMDTAVEGISDALNLVKPKSKSGGRKAKSIPIN